MRLADYNLIINVGGETADDEDLMDSLCDILDDMDIETELEDLGVRIKAKLNKLRATTNIGCDEDIFVKLI